ncbi:MAG TPA: hypothetical protein VN690_10875 [Terriglobales bacterium]|nr:hypothetical protein [Terriglobales bacterium]
MAVAHLAPGAPDPALMASALRDFLSTHEGVHVSEAGQPVARLDSASGYALDCASGHLVFHLWSADANFVRRVLRAAPRDSQRMDLDCWRMGHPRPTRVVLDARSPLLASPAQPRAQAREDFQSQLLAAITRAWPGWHLDRAATGPAELRTSGGASGLLRLLFRRQHQTLAWLALEAGEPAGAYDALLAQGLAWIELLRARNSNSPLKSVHLVLPEAARRVLAGRSRWLRSHPPLACFRFDASSGELEATPLEDDGNCSTVLRRAPARASEPQSPASAELLAHVRSRCPDAAWEIGPSGAGRVLVFGLEVAREALPGELLAPHYFGIGREASPLVPAAQPLLDRLLDQVARERVPGRDARAPLYALQPERWMEHLLRADPSRLDPSLASGAIQSQISLGTGRILDLLALDRDGRLVVIELKAGEDLGFPLQALDYWRWVRHHQHLGDFERLGYFPGRGISPLPPRLWLVAPALRWHPHTDLVARWFSCQGDNAVPLTCLGLNETWRAGFQVLFRKHLSAA